MNLQLAKTKLSKFIEHLAYVPQTLRLIWAAAPGWTIAWAFLLVVQGLLPAATIYLTRLLVDSLTSAVGQGVAWQTIQPTVMIGVAMVVVLLLSQVVQGALEWARLGQSEYISDYLTSLVHDKAVVMDLASYESPEYHDHLFQASQDLKTRPLSLLESSGSLLQSCITLIAVGALLIPYGFWLPAVLVISTLPAFAIVVRYNRIYHRWWRASIPDRRWEQYFDGMLTYDFVASEVRLFDLGELIQSKYQNIRRRLRAERIRLTKKRALASLLATLFAALVTGLALVWMVWQAFLGIVTLGDLVLFYQTVTKGQGMLQNLLSSFGQINSNLLFLGNLFAFLNLEPKIIDPPLSTPTPERLQQGIRLRQVTFRYPGSHATVFENFDLFIPANKIVALVGANGAGKTTLIKLLCRLYDPDAGRIEFDGIEIRNFRVKELRKMFTGMFQFPVRYVTTAKENITLSHQVERIEPSCVEKAARQAGAHEFVSRLPQGYETLLGRLFPEGVELSGGEWQRMALARAFFRQAPIMILDEPTSSMDSWSEIDWFVRLRELTANCTTLLITHRLTIAKNADIVYVMEDGRIVESGSHEELLALGGRYANSWHAQTQQSPAEDEINLDELSVAIAPA